MERRQEDGAAASRMNDFLSAWCVRNVYSITRTLTAVVRLIRWTPRGMSMISPGRALFSLACVYVVGEYRPEKELRHGTEKQGCVGNRDQERGA